MRLFAFGVEVHTIPYHTIPWSDGMLWSLARDPLLLVVITFVADKYEIVAIAEDGNTSRGPCGPCYQARPRERRWQHQVFDQATGEGGIGLWSQRQEQASQETGGKSIDIVEIRRLMLNMIALDDNRDA